MSDPPGESEHPNPQTGHVLVGVGLLIAVLSAGVVLWSAPLWHGVAVLGVMFGGVLYGLGVGKGES